MSVAFNADATVLATASYDRTAKLWRVEDGVCLQTIAGHRILAQNNIYIYKTSGQKRKDIRDVFL